MKNRTFKLGQNKNNYLWVGEINVIIHKIIKEIWLNFKNIYTIIVFLSINTAGGAENFQNVGVWLEKHFQLCNTDYRNLKTCVNALSSLSSIYRTSQLMYFLLWKMTMGEFAKSQNMPEVEIQKGAFIRKGEY